MEKREPVVAPEVKGEDGQGLPPFRPVHDAGPIPVIHALYLNKSAWVPVRSNIIRVSSILYINNQSGLM